jgi:pantoate--beta-alanine ligase
MQIVNTTTQLRETISNAHSQNLRVGFVPTMGNLHEGHLTLVKRAKEICDYVVVSIFVNPLQFGANEDLDKYPRTPDRDAELLEGAGANLLFMPTVEEMYPGNLQMQTKVSVPDITTLLEGASRPGHFDGVSTVVTKLFNMVQPDTALFGEKDYQQLAVIRRMAADLCLPIEIIGVPTVRANDGLALSSRNGFLTPEQRTLAPSIHAALTAAKTALEQGRRDIAQIEQEAITALQKAGFKPDYIHIRDGVTLRDVLPDSKSLVILAAASLGNTRLIDNVTLALNATNV